MTDYTVSVNISGSTVSRSYSPTPAGSGTSGDPFQFADNDRIRVTNNSFTQDCTWSYADDFFDGSGTSETVASLSTSGYKTVSNATGSYTMTFFLPNESGGGGGEE